LGWSHSSDFTTCLEYSVTVAPPVSFPSWLRKNLMGRAHAFSGIHGRVLNTNEPRLFQVWNVCSGTSSSYGGTIHGYSRAVYPHAIETDQLRSGPGPTGRR
jgi:hypothetical protein